MVAIRNFLCLRSPIRNPGYPVRGAAIRNSLLLLPLLAGCEDGIDSTYGVRSGAIGGDSVNGTAVLAGMFQRAGHEVSRTSWLSPRIRAKADVIVWAPDDFEPPSDEVCDWFEQWWRDEPGHILIYIGRDYDAAPAYWRAVAAGAPRDNKFREIQRRLAQAQNEFREARADLPDRAKGRWFTIQGKLKHRDVRTLDGPWSQGIVAERIEIELNRRLVPPAAARVLLSSEGEPLVSRRDLAGASLIMVVNGSFLLNEPLVNHEHRKLAARLIAEVPSERHVVFLESGKGGPRVLDKEPEEAMANGLEILGIEPFNWIFLHLAVLGLIFCVARFPIFGIARPLDSAGLSDFGRHIAALGKLLARTGDRDYAIARVQHYQQNVRRKPGRFRRAVGAAEASPVAGTSPFAEPPLAAEKTRRGDAGTRGDN